MRNIHLKNVLDRTRFMAKVDGPLFSLEARGKIGDAIVFFPWKGIHSVRRWLKPTNPNDIDQRIIRQKMNALGKCVKAIETATTALPNGSALVVATKAKMGATDIWNAFFVKSAITDLSNDATFTALSAAIFATAVTANWRAAAILLGLETIVTTSPGVATDISPELQLAMAAYAAYKMELSDATSIFSTYPSSWGSDLVTLFAADFTKAY